jgi:hypothetical protein
MEDLGIHKSEWDWVGHEFEYVIENDGTIQDLGDKVDHLLTLIGK